MKAIRYNGVAIAFLLMVLTAPAMRAQKSSKEGDTEAIKGMVGKFTQAFNSHDAQAQAALFADDADFTNLRGVSRRGRKNIEANFVTLFGGILKNAKRTDSVRSVRLLSPTLAAVDSDATIDGSLGPNGSPNPLRKGLMMLIAQKQGGQWKIVVFHEEDYPEAPAATTSSR